MAVSDFVMVIDTIKGESTADKIPDGIDIDSFSWGVTNAGSGQHGTGQGTGKAFFQDFHFTKKVDKASPGIAKACALGTHIKKAVLHVRKAGNGASEYYTVTLESVLISSFMAGGMPGNPIVQDQFSLNYAKIKWEYKPQDAKGALGSATEFGWDVPANKTV